MGRLTNAEFPCLLPVESRHQPPGTSVCASAWKLTWASVSRIFIEVLLPMHGWCNDCSRDVTELNLQPLPLTIDRADSNPLIPRLVFLTSHPESSHQQKLRCGWAVNHESQRHSNNSRNVKDLEAVSQEPGAKTRQIPYNIRLQKIVAFILLVEWLSWWLWWSKWQSTTLEDLNPINNNVGEDGSWFFPSRAFR